MTWNQRWIAKVLLVRWLARLSAPLLWIFVGFGVAAAVFIGEPKAKIFGIVSISCFFASFLCALVGRCLIPWRSFRRSDRPETLRVRAMGAGR